MNISFSGQRALVTGAGQGIGYDIAKALVAGGAETYALSKTQANLDKLKAEVPDVHLVCVDLRDWDKTRAAVEKIVKEAGPIHLLVNNAGVIQVEGFMEVTGDLVDTIVGVNLKPIYNISQVVGESLKDAKLPGSIVNVSSMVSRRAFHVQAVYAPLKSALDQLTRVMALNLGKHNIRVNAVNPTVVLTAMSRQFEHLPLLEDIRARCPLGRHAEMEEVVNPVMFLLSDKAAMINGVCLPIDGGFLAC